MTTALKKSVARQRDALAKMLAAPMHRLAGQCAGAWDDRERLDRKLAAGMKELPYCKYLYALDPDRVQISDNVSQTGLIIKDFGRDRSRRPYMKELPRDEFVLSGAYISLRARRPSLTAVQAVRNDEVLLGYIGADFDMRDLPLTRVLYEEPKQWRQVKGDPAIRSGVFQQTRVESVLDRHIEEVLAVLEELIVEHGVFHTKVHFSSSRATIWLVDDPFGYRLLDIDVLMDPDMCLVYPRRPYPDNVVVPEDAIRPILQRLRELRFTDENIYLRSGTVNIFNGMVSLTFSCDGSHYLPYEDFLSADMSFWGGGSGAA